MILITGGAGFIGSNMINYLVKKGNTIISVDWHNKTNEKYFINNNFEKLKPENLENFLKKNKNNISIILHLGAITSTTEKNLDLIIKNNLKLSISLWNWCKVNKKRFIYASSAATYGKGEHGFIDNSDDSYLSKLVPLNLYGWSKHIIDRIIWNKLILKKTSIQCVGLKFFNVYGPNEFHKNEMKSIILKIHEKIKDNKVVTLFKSHNPDYLDGEQLRDFIYVKDIVEVINWFIKKPEISGLFNVGSSTPQSFNNLAKYVYRNCNKKYKVNYIETPPSIRDQYQYFTKASLSKLRKAGYKKKFYSLEEGISDYVKNYLIKV